METCKLNNEQMELVLSEEMEKLDSYNNSSMETLPCSSRSSGINQKVNETAKEELSEIEDSTNKSRNLHSSKYLFKMMYDKNITQLLEAIPLIDKKDLNIDDGSFTLLQLACYQGLESVVTSLLNGKADPNLTCCVKPQKPIILAAQQGLVNIVKTLVENSAISDDETVIVSITKGMANYKYKKETPKNINYHECLKMIIDKIKSAQAATNCEDSEGNTPLHYAAKHGDPKVILLLLQRGAHIGKKNNSGDPNFRKIEIKLLKRYFNECVSTSNDLPHDEDYEIIISYNFLASTTCALNDSDNDSFIEESNANERSVTCETESLLVMSQLPNFQPLLRHPVIKTFINIKWHLLKHIILINLLFYLAVVGFSTSFILTITKPHSVNDAKESTDSVSTFHQVPTLDTELFAMLVSMLITRTILRMLLTKSFSQEDCFELAIVGTTGLIQFVKNPGLSYISIILSWLHLFRQPNLSQHFRTKTEVLLIAFWSFLELFVLYSVLVIPLILCFYILYSMNGGIGDDCFMNLKKAVIYFFATILGEIDTSILFSETIVLYVVPVALVIIFVVVVMFNLLIGLTLGDTNSIKEEAELNTCVKTVKILYDIESTALTCSKYIKTKLGIHACSIFAWIIRIPSVLGGDNVISILPNRNNSVQNFKLRLDKTVIRALIMILKQKKGDVVANKQEGKGKTDELINKYVMDLNTLKTYVEVMMETVVNIMEKQENFSKPQVSQQEKPKTYQVNHAMVDSSWLGMSDFNISTDKKLSTDWSNDHKQDDNTKSRIKTPFSDFAYSDSNLIRNSFCGQDKGSFWQQLKVDTIERTKRNVHNISKYLDPNPGGEDSTYPQNMLGIQKIKKLISDIKSLEINSSHRLKNNELEDEFENSKLQKFPPSSNVALNFYLMLFYSEDFNCHLLMVLLYLKIIMAITVLLSS